ncbi:MAG: hypothetical protein R3Y59_01700 [bacterium]
MACSSSTKSEELIYTENGIGVLTFGGKIDELPKKVDGMYDRIESIYDDFDGSTHNYFYLGEELKYDVTWDNEIVNITAFDTNVDFGGFRVGDPMSKILALNPKYEITNYGVNVSINGCHLWLGELTKSGEEKSHRAYGLGEEIRYDEKDFTETATLKAVIVTKK